MPKRSFINRTVEVILLQDHRYLGEKYEVVRVKPIYAKNVLFPEGIAVLATPGTLHDYQAKMEAAEKKREKKAASFEDLVQKITDAEGVTISRKINEKKSLYSKVDAQDVSTAIKEQFDIEVPSQYIAIKKKISTLGEFSVPLTYGEMKKMITIKIVAEAEASSEPQKEEKAETTEA